MRVAIVTDVANGENLSVRGPVEAVRRLQDLAASGIRHYAMPGAPGDAGCCRNQIGFWKGEQPCAYRIVLAMIHVAGKINRVIVEAEGWEICKVAVIGISLKQKAVPGQSRVRPVGNGEKEIVGFEGRIGGGIGIKIHHRGEPPLGGGIINDSWVGHGCVRRKYQARIGPEMKIRDALNALAIGFVIDRKGAIDELDEVTRSDDAIGIERQGRGIYEEGAPKKILSDSHRWNLRSAGTKQWARYDEHKTGEQFWSQRTGRMEDASQGHPDGTALGRG